MYEFQQTPQVGQASGFDCSGPLPHCPICRAPVAVSMENLRSDPPPRFFLHVAYAQLKHE